MEEISKIIRQVEKIIIRKDGREKEFATGSDGYRSILRAWGEMTEGARRMPAFGVSLDALTRKQMREGTWLEFCFPKEFECDGLPFRSLLVQVRSEYRGFNLVRNTQGLYEGRCLYVDLNGDMSALSGALEQLAE